ncbi:MAG: DUF3243 domain-containing protein [Peptococcaceae bacterium]|nr:DUF3243 domain-containing protein [Peptococcaceae bacterium]
MESSVHTLESFQQWQEFLGRGTKFLEKLGLSDDNVAGLAKGMGDFLAENMDPENPQQRVLKDLWDSADDQEKHMLARLVTRMSKHHVTHEH